MLEVVVRLLLLPLLLESDAPVVELVAEDFRFFDPIEDIANPCASNSRKPMVGYERQGLLRSRVIAFV